MKKEELNLDNPIFVFYINVEGYSRQKAEEHIQEIIENFDIYKNAKIWILASKETKVECIYDGWGRSRDSELKELIGDINERIEILSKSHSFEDFKINIRDWRIDNITKDNEN